MPNAYRQKAEWSSIDTTVWDTYVGYILNWGPSQ